MLLGSILNNLIDWLVKPSSEIFSLDLGGMILFDLVREDPVSVNDTAKDSGLSYLMILIISVRVELAIIWWTDCHLTWWRISAVGRHWRSVFDGRVIRAAFLCMDWRREISYFVKEDFWGS